MAAWGVAAGGVAALAAAFYMNRIFQTTNMGAGSIFYSMTIVAVVSFAASVLPAWRAARVSPLLAIRERA